MSIILTWDQHKYQKTYVISHKVIHLKLFLDHFRLLKSQEDQELTNPVTPVSQIYKRGIYKEMFYQHKVNSNVRSRVAYRKRAGPITQRSEDQNLALLVIVLSIKMFKGHLLTFTVYFTSSDKAN